MERLTAKNINTGLPCLNGEVEFMPISKDCIPLLQKGITKLSAYEDTGYTPEEVKNLEKIARDQSNNMIKKGLEMERLYNECEKWKKEALECAAQPEKL